MVEVLTIYCDGNSSLDEAIVLCDAKQISYRPAQAMGDGLEVFIDSNQRKELINELKQLHYGVVEGE